ncbi:MAG: hypothetical protein DA330_08330, partial [Nitrososphaera sp.]|nr:hypothetical protein [Nitrososphaera sp.]
MLNVVLFLGAGASVPFGKPTTKDFKKRLTMDYAETDDEVIQTFLNNNDFEDIEDVLQAIRDVLKFVNSYGGQYFLNSGKKIFYYKKEGLPFDSYVRKLESLEKDLKSSVYSTYGWNKKYDKPLKNIYWRIFDLMRKWNSTIDIF